MRARTYTVRTLLIWAVLFAAFCAGLRAVDAPLVLFAWLFSWAATVWLATMLCSGLAARGISAAISAVFGGIALGTVVVPATDPGPSLLENIYKAIIIDVVFFIPAGVAFGCVVEFVNDLIEGRWRWRRGADSSDSAEKPGEEVTGKTSDGPLDLRKR